MLYVYESKLALLMKMCGSRRGAETVLAQGALGALGALRVLRAHPDLHAAPPPSADFLPSVADRSRTHEPIHSILHKETCLLPASSRLVSRNRYLQLGSKTF